MNPMNRTRRGPKLFGLCALALALVAVGAATAQASATWMLKSESLLSTSENKALVGHIVLSDGRLLSTIGVNTFTFLCTTSELLNTKLEPEGKVSENSKNAKFDFSGCTTTINGTVAPKCVPSDGAKKGVILSEEVYALLALHALEGGTKDGVVVITPKTGTVLSVIHMGEACAFGEEVKVLGTLALKDSGSNAGLEKESGTHTFEEFAPLTKLTTATEKGEGKATLDGKLELELESKEAWSGLPDAKLRIESCMGEGTECKLASAGTTFTTSSESFVLGSTEEGEPEGEPATDECESTLSEEVVDPLSEGASDKIEISVSKMEFSECTTTTLEAVGLPWTVSTDLSSFAAKKEMRWDLFLISTGFGCNYVTSGPDIVFQKWDASPLRDLDLGSLVYESGPFYCFSLKTINGTLLLIGVNDPNLAGASSLVIR